MLSRPHPLHGWLWLKPTEWRTTLQRSLAERDRLDDPRFVGMVPAFLEWVADEQMPDLARQEHYRRQMEDRLSDRQAELNRLLKQISSGRLDLRSDAVAVDRECKALQVWLR